VNVHPSKTEVRFRQQSVMHDFLRDSVRAALMKARPVPQFVTEIRAHPTASPSLTPGARGVAEAGAGWQFGAAAPQDFNLQAPPQPAIAERFHFADGIAVEANAAIPVARFPRQTFGGQWKRARRAIALRPSKSSTRRSRRFQACHLSSRSDSCASHSFWR